MEHKPTDVSVYCLECCTPMKLTPEQFKNYVRLEAGLCQKCLQALVDGYHAKKKNDAIDAFVHAMEQQKRGYERGVPVPWFPCDQLSFKDVEEIVSHRGWRIEHFVDPLDGSQHYRYLPDLKTVKN